MYRDAKGNSWPAHCCLKAPEYQARLINVAIVLHSIYVFIPITPLVQVILRCKKLLTHP